MLSYFYKLSIYKFIPSVCLDSLSIHILRLHADWNVSILIAIMLPFRKSDPASNLGLYNRVMSGTTDYGVFSCTIYLSRVTGRAYLSRP